MRTDKTSPEVMKVLVALAINLRNSARNVREKEAAELALPEHKNITTLQVSCVTQMSFQARAMHHALFNGFFIAKKAAGRKKLF